MILRIHRVFGFIRDIQFKYALITLHYNTLQVLTWISFSTTAIVNNFLFFCSSLFSLLAAFQFSLKSLGLLLTFKYAKSRTFTTFCVWVAVCNWSLDFMTLLWLQSLLFLISCLIQIKYINKHARIHFNFTFALVLQLWRAAILPFALPVLLIFRQLLRLKNAGNNIIFESLDVNIIKRY